MANKLYQKLIRQYSDDNGLTWKNIDPPVYKIGNVIEYPSNCKSEQTKKCRWSEYPITVTHICENGNMYFTNYEECTTDGKIWRKTGKEEKGRLYKENSSECDEGLDIVFSFTGEKMYYNYNNEQFEATQSPYVVTFRKTDNVTSFANFFVEQHNLTMINGLPSYFKDIDISKMFYICDNLTFINTDYFDIRPTAMAQTFRSCSELTELNLSHLDVRNCTDINNLFNGCLKLRKLDLSKWNLKPDVISYDAFGFCPVLETIVMNNCTCETISMVKEMLKQSKIPDGQVTILTNTNCGDTPTPSEKDLSFTFDGNSLTYKINGEPYDVYSSPADISLKDLGIGSVTSLYEMFSNQKNLKTITKMPNTKYCTNFDYMLAGCENLTKFDAKLLDTTNARSMNWTFAVLTTDEIIGLNTLNTQHVHSFYGLFNQCYNLIYLNLSGFNLQSCSDLTSMFMGCESLGSINMNGWKLANLNAKHDGMFDGCDRLKKIYLKESNEGTINFIKKALQEANIEGVTIITK